FSQMRPVLGRSRPASSASSVDLPAPEASITATVSPGAMLKLTSERMVRSPSGLLTCLLTLSAMSTALLLPDRFVMRKLLTLLLILGAATAIGANSPTVLVLGDSLSAGYGIDVDQSWTALLQSRLQEEGYEHRVVNASITGETTEGGASRIGSALAEFGPEVVVIALGGNDGLRGFPPERIKANLGKIIDAAADEEIG